MWIIAARIGISLLVAGAVALAADQHSKREDEQRKRESEQRKRESEQRKRRDAQRKLKAEQNKRAAEQREAAQLQKALKKRLEKVEQERDYHVAWFGRTTEQAREYAREIKRLRAELAEARRRAAG